MSWNYRVVYVPSENVGGVEGLYSIQEIYYNDKGIPRGSCAASVADWESLNDLAGTLSKMCEALALPILHETDDGLQEESHTPVVPNSDVAPKGEEIGATSEDKIFTVPGVVNSDGTATRFIARGGPQSQSAEDSEVESLRRQLEATRRLRAAALAVYAVCGPWATQGIEPLMRELGDAADACGYVNET